MVPVFGLFAIAYGCARSQKDSKMAIFFTRSSPGEPLALWRQQAPPPRFDKPLVWALPPRRRRTRESVGTKLPIDDKTRDCR